MYSNSDDPKTMNPSLHGRFAPVGRELDVASPPVRGELPRQLRGMYLRNGPNPQFAPPSRYHFLDGDGMMHGVRLHDGEAVRYHNRWVATQGLGRDRGAGRSTHHGFGDPKLTQRMLSKLAREPRRLLELARAVGAPGELMEQLVQLVGATNVANTSTIRFAGKLLALWEVGRPYELDHELNTMGPANIADLPYGTMCAHPKVEADTGLLHAFAQRYVRGVGVKYYAYDQNWNLREGAEVGISHPTMLHDFAVTARHVVFVVTPLRLTFLRPFIRGGQNWEWMPKRTTQVVVMDRQRIAQGAHGEDAVVCRIDGPASFLYHIGGAFSDGHEVHVDTCMYAAPPLGLGRRPTETLYEKSYLTRLCIDTQRGTLRSWRLSDRAQSSRMSIHIPSVASIAIPTSQVPLRSATTDPTPTTPFTNTMPCAAPPIPGPLTGWR